MARRVGAQVAPRHRQAYALIALQFCLAAMNVRGARKADVPPTDAGAAAD